MLKTVAESVGITGLAVMLAGLSLGAYRAGETKIRFWRWLITDRWWRTGWLLVCVGRLFSLDNGLERVIWLALSAEALYGWWPSRKFVTKKFGPEEAYTPASDSLPNQPQIEEVAHFNRGRLSTGGIWLERTRLIWVGGLLPLFLFGGGRYLLYGIGALFILGVATALTGGGWGRSTLANWLLPGWLLLIPVTLWVTPAPEITLPYLGYYLAELLAFYAVLSWLRSERRLGLVAWGLVGLGTGLALSSLVLLRQGGRFFPALDFITRLASSLPLTAHKNIMGGLLALMLPLSLGLIVAQIAGKAGRVRLGAAGLSFLIIAAGLVLTQSRGAWLAAGVALLGMALLGLGQWRGLLVSLGLFGSGVAGLLFSGQFNSLLAQIIHSDAFGGLEGRLEIWSRVGYAIHDYPFTGIGLGSFAKIIPAFYPYFLANPEPILHTHNLFLQIGLDLGLPGLINFVALLILSGASGFTAWQRWHNTGKALSWLILGGLGSLAALVTHGLLDAVIWGTKPAFLAWAVLGLLTAAGLLPTSKNSSFSK